MVFSRAMISSDIIVEITSKESDIVVEITSNEKFLLNLPSDILMEILSRLTVVDVIKNKLVCKRLLSIFSTPEFARLHLSRSNLCLFTFQMEDSKDFCRVFRFGDENDGHILCDDPVIEFDFKLFRCSMGRWINLDMVGSINGLVCFHHRSEEVLYVCNPVTREYLRLPHLRRTKCWNVELYGFGVSNDSGQYKAVKICQSWVGKGSDYTRIKESKCYIYTLGTSLWRSIDGPPIMYAYSENCPRDIVFFSGNLHWVIQDLEGSELISCFDLEKESFQPFPPPFPGEQRKRHCLFSLGVVRGCLCLCDNTSDCDIVIWVMKEYGVGKSWTKEFVTRKIWSFKGIYTRGKITPLGISENGDILFVFSFGGELFTYNNESRSLRRDDKVVLLCLEAMLFVPSVISLKTFEPEKVRMLQSDRVKPFRHGILFRY